MGKSTLVLLLMPLLSSVPRHAQHFASPASASSTPVSTAASEGLTRELLSAKRRAPMDFYARAFMAYAWVGRGLGDSSSRAEATRSVDALLKQVREPAFQDAFRLPRSVGYTGHLALMLEGRRRLGPLEPAQEALADQHLLETAREVLATPGRLLPTYGRRIWPADNEVLAVALRLASRREGSPPEVHAAAAALTEALLAFERTSLPPSEVDANGQALAVPRGCALSWTVALRGLEGPARAAPLYARFREEFFVGHFGLAGFREYPKGVDGPADVDSGPIVLGVGVAASGIGLTASRLAGASDDEASLRRTAGLAQRLPQAGKAGRTHIARAMLLWAESARAWEPSP